ncbi:choice-of-anchor H family protein [Litorilituus lipolyticus]|uniref:GlyGly-CTERM sorting domain-containing protein n=1 Tax=Litorilituus lipolyticus TaxID=2491017 RepID=A0A502KVR5_9GAMM|nr:choice-of-anchor H family protein [Litorilituus lipolyticus]TPH15850.1 hypothetical protein EPA86_07735 [Litorilituus lipolyticus]
MNKLLSRTIVFTSLLLSFINIANAESFVASTNTTNSNSELTLKAYSKGSFKGKDKQTKDSPFAATNVIKSELINGAKTAETTNTKNSSKETNATGLIRADHIKIKSARRNTLSNSLINSTTPDGMESHYTISASNSATLLHHDSYSIYDAYSFLLDDVDFDGYYQSFSITFDADFYPYSYISYVNVYAELYLSHNGGPWVHYYSTDVFTLYGQSEEDEYEVITTLQQGFTPGSYDVLIDLYDADYEELVVSYSADDNNSLYALPLESTEYDQVYETEVIYSSGGSFNFIVILTLTSLLLFRNKFITS